MEYRIIISSFVSLVALILGIYIFRQDTKSTPNRLALLICICMVERYVNSLLMFSLDISREKVILLFNINSSFYRALFPMFLHFYISLKEKKPLSARILLLIYIPALLILPLPVIFQENHIDVVFSSGIWKFIPTPKPNIWTNIIKLYQWIYFFAAILTAFLYWKQAQLNREKRQAAVLLIANLVYLAALLITEFLILKGLPRSFDLWMYPRMILLFGLYFAVFKYRFLAPDTSLVAENIIAHISDMVILLDNRFRIISANKTASLILGENADKLKGIDFFNIIRAGSDTREKLSGFPGSNEDSFNLRLAYVKCGDEPVMTESYFSRIKDKFNDTAGALVISRQLPGRKDFEKTYGISAREMEIVDLILAGNSARIIGEKLNISERTVESHFANIYNKLGVSNKGALFNLSARFNLVQ